jgi:hypothetical protein
MSPRFLRTFMPQLASLATGISGQEAGPGISKRLWWMRYSRLGPSIGSKRGRGIFADVANWRHSRDRRSYSLEALIAEIDAAGVVNWAHHFGNLQVSPHRSAAIRTFESSGRPAGRRCPSPPWDKYR